MNDNTDLWWYASNNQKFGPYTQAQLHDLGRAGEIRDNDLVWRQGLSDWVPANSIEGLVITPPPALPVLEAIEPPIEIPSTQPVDLMATFVGENYGFYARRWTQSERVGGVISWNWAAFFLGLFWLAYRKMYLYCAVVIGVALAITGIAQIAQVPPETLQTWQVMYIAPVFSALLGLFGNWLYKQHALRKIRQITTSNNLNTSLELERQGGASMISVLAVIALMLMSSALVGLVITQFFAPSP